MRVTSVNNNQPNFKATLQGPKVLENFETSIRNAIGGFADNHIQLVIDSFRRHASEPKFKTAIEQIKCPDGRNPIITEVNFEESGAPSTFLYKAILQHPENQVTEEGGTYINLNRMPEEAGKTLADVLLTIVNFASNKFKS